MSLNVSSGKSLFESEIKINFKTVLSVSLRIWKISNFSIEYFLHKSAIYFCGKQKVSVLQTLVIFQTYIKWLHLFHFFFYSKRFHAGRFPIVKFKYHFCFSRVKTVCDFFIYFFKFSFFLPFYFFERINTIILRCNSSSIYFS